MKPQIFVIDHVALIILSSDLPQNDQIFVPEAIAVALEAKIAILGSVT